MFLLLQGVLLNNIAVNKPVPAEKLVRARWVVGLTLSTYLLCFWLILRSVLTRWSSLPLKLSCWAVGMWLGM